MSNGLGCRGHYFYRKRNFWGHYFGCIGKRGLVCLLTNPQLLRKKQGYILTDNNIKTHFKDKGGRVHAFPDYIILNNNNKSKCDNSVM